jgi:signal transduction histidine kinase
MGVLVFSRRDVFFRRLMFLVETVACSAWAIGIAVFIAADSEAMMRTAAQVFYIAAAGIAWVWVPLAYVLSSTERKGRAALAAAASFVPFAVLAAVIAVRPEVMMGGFYTSPNHGVALTDFYNIYAIYFMVYSLIAFVILVSRYETAPNLAARNKNKYLLWAYCVSLVIGCVFNLILPWVGNYALIYIGPINMAIFALAIYFTSTRHRMFDIGATIGRIFGLVVSAGGLTLIYVLVVSFLHTIVKGGDYIVVDAVVVAVLGGAFYFLVLFVSRSADRIFTNTILSPKLFDDISRLAIDNVDVQRMLDRITRTIVKSSKSGFALIKIGVANKELISRAQCPEIIGKVDLEVIHEALMKRKTGVLVAEEVNTKDEVYNVLTKNGISIVSILRDSDTHQIIGMLVIGQEKPTLYSDKEITALSAICDVIVIAVRNSELSMMDKTKDEFMSLASHQLRTPLTSIQGYASMILEGDFGKVNGAQAKALDEVVASSRRMAVLINDLLNISRLQSGKFIISRTATSMAELVREEIDQSQLMASAHGIEIQYTDAGWDDIPEVAIDRAKVGEVMANLIDNAVFYSRHGSTVEISLVRNGGEVEFRVKDHGIGVPKKDQADLFTKFFRASNARTVRPDGTGIGLFLAKKVIVDHGGTIIFESVEGKGSTFGFSLPLDT